MADSRRWLRRARRAFARIQQFRPLQVPDAPAQAAHDPWPGDAARGARMVKGELDVAGTIRAVRPGTWNQGDGQQVARAEVHGFTWLRDLRALGTDAARGRARTLIADWIGAQHADPIIERPDVVGARIAAWLGHYDFFAASADDGFRRKLMSRVAADAVTLAAALPAEELDARALTALKGLIAASVALPEHPALLTRALRFLPQEISRQILPDGCHAERSPAAQLAALKDLIEIRSLLQSINAAQPAPVTSAIERMVLALRAMRHGDGGLVLFNGSKEEGPELIDLVLTQAGRTGRAPTALADGGFYRLAAGRSVLIVDAGAPAPRGLDRFAHAGTLAFELSIGRERLVVNCGAAPAASDARRDALRATAAHSTLVIADVNSSEITPEGLGRRPEKVEVERQEASGAHWLEASHDGWLKPFGAIHRRRLYMAESGEDVRGEDAVEAAQPQPFAVRFHLHPDVTASLQQDGEAALLQLSSGGGWRLRAEGARMTLEESIYLGHNEARRAEQVVLSGYADGAQQVKWAISKVG
ncbi:MAG: heparinase II/III family protein [Acetobacteraceae bacterium]